MQVINIRQPFDPARIPDGNVVLAMGFFDGLHRGHQAVIERARNFAKEYGLPLAVLTYDHHPSIVYHASEQRITYLSPVQRKLELLDELGVDITYLVSFTSALSALKPQEFVDQYMIGFHAKIVVAGFDHTYGPKDIATMANLPKFAKDRFKVVEVSENLDDDLKISSTRIRHELDEGNVSLANRLLGYSYQTSGTVVHGEARGRELGFPTANIEWPVEERMPGIGVYAVQLKIGEIWYDGMASIGYNVTFGDDRPKTLEINLFDFKNMIYGENVKVRWVARLRGEVKYTTAEALIDQLKNDEIETRKILKINV
ncbi:riboflavin biosynthesis protein RibF [Paucilactobacillus suebicus]|uniref:Riboflavin biosynthesis protein n=1 Tax=Paucilactobacillus suebicus DSM 5007 = KCTC 3549 TaxID=1423807 RepID=A0A0R1W3I3_9LACO|nr:riboflavin biosynthesis protein RibF [Paucilactobacillus suebicus]KRM12063.1 riboflavin biosynthesis protein RibF [Paucilactobacillus suebicus DSM 5007 = KCTC 3549]